MNPPDPRLRADLIPAAWFVAFAQRLAVFALVALASTLFLGCAGRAGNVHLRTAAETRNVIDDAADTIEAICTVEALDAANDREQFRTRCVAAQEAQHLAVSAWTTWVTVAAQDGLDAPAALAAISRLVAVYQDLVDFAVAFGRELPALPVGG